MNLQDKVAIVTGSASGIGKAAAETLTRSHVKVVICDRDQDLGEQVVSDIRRNGGSAVFLHVDLLDPLAAELMVKQAVDTWGRIDFIINSAAIVCNKALESVTHEDWDRVFAVNLKACFFLVQSALPYLKESRGSIVNISSLGGVINSSHNFVYDSLKAALNQLTTGMALELREFGVRCNALMPGGIDTPLLKTWFHQSVDDPEEAEQVAELEKHSPRCGAPQQVADAVLFLCSEQASWVNGALIPIDGGYHLGSSS